MPLRNLSYAEVRRRLLALGFLEIGQRGSHVKFGKRTPQGLRTVVVPRHRTIAPGTLRSVLRQAGISLDVFESVI